MSCSGHTQEHALTKRASADAPFYMAGGSQELALTERTPVLIAFSIANLNDDVQIVRRRFGQKLDAGDAMAFLAQSKDVVKLPMKTLFRIASRTNFPLALDAYSQ